MRKTLPLLLIPALMTLLAGCSSSLTSTGGITTTSSGVPVAVSMTDDPPAGVSVLFFQVSLTSATLTPKTGPSVSLLSNNTPIQIDVTQLQALSAFLSTANVPPDTYSNLSLTFADPQLVIFNESDTSLGSGCAVGTVCQLTPTFDGTSATQTFTSAPFPLTVSTGSPLGLLIDFHLNTVIQPDLSVNLSATNGVSVSTLPPLPTPRFGYLTGTVGTVTASSNQFTLTTRWGRTFTIDTTSNTTFNDFPSSACTTAGIACLAQGQIVKAQISGFSSGALTASQVTYIQQATAQTVEGTIVAIPPLPLPAGETLLKVILHRSPDATSTLPLGGFASVTVWGPLSSNTPTTFSIDNNGFTIPSGLTFTSAANLCVGQNVKITIVPGSITNTGAGPAANVWGPPPSLSFTASALALEPSQLTGDITAINSGATSFTLGFGGPFFVPWPTAAATANAISFNVVTTSQTNYTGFTLDTFDGLATGDFVSVNGWLFPPATTGPPTVAAQSVVLRPSPAF
ncbi:MAG TPA: DUF4382 domain-containing protein [Terracidiphilus sp.]|nr:DUF4382 domain-containing protein [Terracidiphilus sp.]